MQYHTCLKQLLFPFAPVVRLVIFTLEPPSSLHRVAVIGVICPYPKFGQSDITEQINTNIPAVLRIIEDGSTLQLQNITTSKYHKFEI